jgi:hypothetical protein
MDYEQYFANQATNKIPVFEGYRFQRGYGLGGVFRKLFKWIMPIVKQHAVPVAKTLGEEILKGAINIAKDALRGRNIKESANHRFEETLNELSHKAGVMKGDGLASDINTLNKTNKRKRKLKQILKSNFRRKRKVDIFDK